MRIIIGGMARNDRKQHQDLSVEELEQLLYHKKRAARRQRLRRLHQDGRVVQVAGVKAPNQQTLAAVDGPSLPAGRSETATPAALPKQGKGRRLADKLLLLVEVLAVVGLVLVLFNLWSAQRELNQELTAVHQAEVAELGPPTPEPTPVIDLVVLPTGHQYIEGRSPEPVESGDIPDHLLPVLQAYQPPPIPTPSPEQAQVIQIPAIGVHHAIVEGAYDWEQLKRGVAHHIGSAEPGHSGNMILAAHNDIYGAIFRDLDKLSPGDEIIVSTNQKSYTYVVTKIQVVEPTEVWVMGESEHASATLISCYPYRINTHRIAVFADLVTGDSG